MTRNPRAPSTGPARSHDGIVALIVATNWWPVSARLAMRLLAHRCEVVALCPRGHVLSQLTGLRGVRTYSGLNSLAALESAIRSSNPTIVIPCDDRAVWQLHELHRRLPDLRDLIVRSLGDPAHFATIRSRAQLLEVAARSEIHVPETRRVLRTDDIADWFGRVSGPAVMKMDGTWGGSGVSVVRTEAEAQSAWRKFAPETRSARWKRRWKEWLLYSDPLAFWDDPALGRRGILLQRYVAGRQANSMLACWRGKLLGVVNVEVLCTEQASATSPSTIVRLIDHPQMTHAAGVLCAALGLSGFYGLDFILEAGSNRAQLIELNARCTRLGHLRLPGQDDLAALLAKHMGALPPDTDAEAIVNRDIIAFFPQALSWNPESPYLHECHVDVPWSEPQLIAALVRRPWAYTRPLFRLYHDGLKKPRDPTPSIPGLMRIAAQTARSGEFAVASGAVAPLANNFLVARRARRDSNSRVPGS